MGVSKRGEGDRMAHTTVSRSDPLGQFPKLVSVVRGFLLLAIPKLLLATTEQLHQFPFRPGEEGTQGRARTAHSHSHYTHSHTLVLILAYFTFAQPESPVSCRDLEAWGGFNLVVGGRV